MNRITRRTFIKASAAAGISTLVPFSRARSANDDLRLAVIGLNNQGANHVGWFREIPGVRIAALCEVDGDVLGREMKKFDERNEKSRPLPMFVNSSTIRISMRSSWPRPTIGTP
jgi:hypothetical protein